MVLDGGGLDMAILVNNLQLEPIDACMTRDNP